MFSLTRAYYRSAQWPAPKERILPESSSIVSVLLNAAIDSLLRWRVLPSDEPVFSKSMVAYLKVFAPWATFNGIYSTGLQLQYAYYVFGACNWRGTGTYEVFYASGDWTGDIARYGQYVFALLKCKSCGVQTAAF